MPCIEQRIRMRQVFSQHQGAPSKHHCDNWLTKSPDPRQQFGLGSGERDVGAAVGFYLYQRKTGWAEE